MKVLITAERYIFIACPDASGMWMSTMKTRLVALAVLLFSVLINLPRYLSVDVIPIDVPITNIPRLHKLDLNSIMINPEVSRKHWFEVLYKTAFYIDLWGPFPLLTLFSIMIYYEVYFIQKNMLYYQHYYVNFKKNSNFRSGKLHMKNENCR